VVEQILKLMNSNLKPDVRNEVTYEIRHQYLSAEKARRILGWEPLFTLEEGLKATIEWYRNFLAQSHEYANQNPS
jgi:CDP-glucose 4,6-dehydratase